MTDHGVKALICGAAGQGLLKLDFAGCHQLSNQGIHNFLKKVRIS
jgi:hypothetical protein